MVAHRAAIRAVAVASKLRQNHPGPSPSKRAPPAESPSAGQWVNPYPRQVRYEGPIAAHERPPVAHPMPPRVELLDPAVFSHPSLTGDPRSFRFEKPASVVKKWDSRVESFEKLEHFGKSLLKMTLTELVSNHYASLTVYAIEELVKKLVGRSHVLDRSAHYSLSDRLLSDPLANKYLRIAPPVRIALFYAYVAGIYQQEGSVYATQWIRQCFRTTLDQEYREMRAELFPKDYAVDSSGAALGSSRQAQPDDTPTTRTRTTTQTTSGRAESTRGPQRARDGAGAAAEALGNGGKLRNSNPVLPALMPLVLLDAHVRQRGDGASAVWNYLVKGIAPNEVFKAELTVGDKTVEGSGKTKNWARQSAAAAYLGISDLDTRLFESSLLPLDEGSYTPRLYEFLKEFDLPLPQFSTQVNPKSPHYKCTLDVGGKVFVATEPIGKVAVRREASRMALDYFNPPHVLETRVLNYFRSREYSHSFAYIWTTTSESTERLGGPDDAAAAAKAEQFQGKEDNIESWTCFIRVKSEGEKRGTREDVAEIRGTGMTKIAARGAAVLRAAEMFGIDRMKNEDERTVDTGARLDSHEGFQPVSSNVPEAVRDAPPHLVAA